MANTQAQDKAAPPQLSLTGWQATRPQLSHRYARWWVCGLAGLGLTALLQTLLAPFHVPIPRVCVIVPGVTNSGPAEAGMRAVVNQPVPSQPVRGQPVPDMLAEQLRGLSNQASQTFALLSTASAEVEFRSNAFKLPSASLSLVGHESSSSRRPLLIYAAGVLCPSAEGCLLCESTAAARQQHGLPISALISAAARAQASTRVICIEAWSDPHRLATQLAPGITVTRCREELEELGRRFSTTSMAVMVIAAKGTEATSASRLLPALQTTLQHAARGTQRQLAGRQWLQAVANELPASATWITTAAWERSSNSLQIPRERVAHKLDSGTQAAEAEIAQETIPSGQLVSGRTSGSVATTQFSRDSSGIGSAQSNSPEDFLAWADQAACRQLLDYCSQQHQRWYRAATQPAELWDPLTIHPTPWMTPAAWQQLESSLVNLERLWQLQPQSQLVRQACWELTRDIAIVVGVLPPTLLDSQNRTHDGWLAWQRAVQGQRSEIAESSLLLAQQQGALDSVQERLLSELRQLTQSTTPEAAGQRLLLGWRTTQNDPATSLTDTPYLELKWADYICGDKSLPWDLRQAWLKQSLRSQELRWTSALYQWQLPSLDSADQQRRDLHDLLSGPRGAAWLTEVRSRLAAAATLYELADHNLQVRTRATRIGAELCRELPHWDRVLIPGEDRHSHHDPICVCISKLIELSKLLELSSAVHTSELMRLTEELEATRHTWQGLAKQALAETQSPAIDLSAYVNSPLLDASLRQASGELTSGAAPPQNNLSRLWMRAQRQLDLSTLLGPTLLAISPESRVSDDLLGLQAALRDLKEQCESSQANSELLLASLLSIERLQLAWLSSLSRDVQPAALGLQHGMWGLGLLTTLTAEQINDQLAQRVAQVALRRGLQGLVDQARAELALSDQEAGRILVSAIEAWERSAMKTGQGLEVDDSLGVVCSVPAMVDLRTLLSQRVPVQLTNKHSIPQTVSLSVQFDPRKVDCELLTVGQVTRAGGSSIAAAAGDVGDSAASRGLCTQVLTVELTPHATRELELAITACKREGGPQAINDLASSKGGDGDGAISIRYATPAGQRKQVMRTRLANTPWVSLRLENEQSLPGGDWRDRSEQFLFANRMNPLTLTVTNRQPRSLRFRLRVWGSQHTIAQPLEGVVELAELEAWIAAQQLLLLVDHGQPYALPPGQEQTLKLPPQPSAPADAASSLHQLIFVLSEMDTNQSQVVCWSPQTARPTSYVRAQVEYEASNEQLQIVLATDPQQTRPAQPVQVIGKLSALQRLDEELNIGAQLSPDGRPTRLQMKLPRGQDDVYVLRLNIDDWPNVWVYRIDRRLSSGKIPVATEALAVRIKHSLANNVMPVGQTSVPVEVETFISDGQWGAGQSILAGIDLNLDRMIAAEPVVNITSPVANSIAWRGVDANGRLLLTSQVTNPLAGLTVSPAWNGRCAVLACLERNGALKWSNSQPLIIDHTPPKISSISVVGGEPASLGKPVEIRVQADDGSLSGVARLQAAWSMAGQPEIAAEQTLVEGRRLPSGEWSLALPTAELQSGSWLLLLRALDAAGNTSETSSRFVEVLNESDLLRYQQSITTSVAGRLLWGTQPLPGLKLELQAKSLTEPVKSTQSDSQGEFLFQGVPSGQYQLHLSGLVRGMRVDRQVPVDVSAPAPPPAIVLRLDRPDAGNTKDNR